MKRWIFALALLIGWSCSASAEMIWEAQTPQRLRTTVGEGGWTVEVDAQIYGLDVETVQAYRVKKRNWGRSPELLPGLEALLPDPLRCEKRTGWTAEDVTLTHPSGKRLDLSPWGNTFASPSGERLLEAVWDVPFSHVAFREQLEIGELPNLSLGEAVAMAEAAADALGMTLGATPLDGKTVTLADMQQEVQDRKEWGLSPNETIIEDWTQADAHYRLMLPQYFHGLMLYPTQSSIPGRENTPVSAVGLIVRREGLEYLSADFVPGEESEQGEPFTPIPVEQALEAGVAELASSAVAADMGNPRVRQAWLCYVPVADKGSTTQYTAVPAWAFVIHYDDLTGCHEPALCNMPIAVDARTGECLTR